jgi:anthranilate synthase component II
MQIIIIKKYRKMNTIIIDNFDSFTYNLCQQVEIITGKRPTIKRNTEVKLEEIAKYEKIILSPGPGIPDEAGLLKQIISTFAPTKSIFGICLGMQAIAEVFNSPLQNLETVFHGVSSTLNIVKPDSTLFKGIKNHIPVGRYHSWIVNNSKVSQDLIVTAVDDANEVMALQHKKYDVHGVQFHPESVMTPDGLCIMRNFLRPIAKNEIYLPDAIRCKEFYENMSPMLSL